MTTKTKEKPTTGTAMKRFAEFKGAVAGADAFHADLQAFKPQFAAALGDRIDPDHFVEMALTAFLDPNNRLGDCDQASLIRSLFRAAQLRLRPDGVEGAIIPRGRIANFEPMYQGIIRTMLRTGTVKKIESRVVKTGDDFEYEYGLDPRLRHRPGPSAGRGGTIAAYAVVWLTNGERQFEVMDFEELEHVRRLTKENNRGKEGPGWKNYPDEMRRKTVVKRLAKYMEQNAELAAVIAYDDAVASGTDVDPRDLLPEFEDRTIEERATEHADRRRDELRSEIEKRKPAEAEAEPEPEDYDEPDSILARTVGFGKHKGKTWREVYETARGYITRWALGDQVDALSNAEKDELRDAVEALDAENAESEPEPEPEASKPEVGSGEPPEGEDVEPEPDVAEDTTDEQDLDEAYVKALGKASELARYGKLPKGKMARLDKLRSSGDLDGLIALDSEFAELLAEAPK